MEIELHLRIEEDSQSRALVVKEISRAMKEINRQRHNDQKCQLKNMSRYLSKRSKQCGKTDN